jgi:hypothetical protein
MKWILTACLFASLTPKAQAWGPQGHMMVAQIAEHKLTPKALAKVKSLLGSGLTMADVANWADSIKSQPQYQKTKGWHYVDIPDGQTYESISHQPDGDAITAINQMITTLKSGASDNDKQTALKFLIHFMGDIHQPLHVGRPDDQGGNKVTVNFEGRTESLHQLWDSGMITKQNLDVDQYVHYLETLNYFLPAETGVPFKQIVVEDMSARKNIYSFGGSSSTPVTIDQTYMNLNVSTMNAHLLLGGKRLAEVINSLFN